MTAQEKIKKAKVSLVISNPFFASLLLPMPLIEADIETMSTDGESIKYNTKFVESVTLPELIGVICHEIMHCAFLHHLRQGTRDHEKWNVAGDYAINLILTKTFTLPKGALINLQYEGMSAEEIYPLLLDKPNQNNQNNSQQDKKHDFGNCGEVTQNKGNKKQKEDKWKIKVVQAYNSAKACGNIPSGLERCIKELIEPKISLREILTRFISDICHNDYSWQFPNKNYLHAGLYVPSLRNKTLKDVVFAVDTSGSISQKELDALCSYGKDVCSFFNFMLKIIWCDSQVQGVEEVYEEDIINLKPKGYGGTNYAPVFEYMKKEDTIPSCLVYLTDGYCHSFGEEPDYPVLWLVTRKKDFVAPFGEVIFADGELKE